VTYETAPGLTMAVNAGAARLNNCQTLVPSKIRSSTRALAAAEGDHLTSLICHDLRHPLSAILAYSELLADCNLDRHQREDLHHEIRLAVGRMNDLISLLVRASSDSQEIKREITDVEGVVKRAIRMVAVRPEFRQVDIRFEHRGSVRGSFDPLGLEQAITNVVLNACEAVSPQSGRIGVKSMGRRDQLEMFISDNGPGIPSSMQATIFQPFVTHGKDKGMGLGLAIAQKILRDHDGDIYLQATGANGTVFRLIVPYSYPGNDGLPTPHEPPRPGGPAE
jgi:signal transduction histidine kinase